ncbi:MAG: hypothetical protein VZQ49_00105 [Methanobrevibacter sp.]|nr:hypothetical protein [Methanobrevibacter sp.]
MIFTGTFNTYDNDQTYSITIGRTGTTTTITDPTDDNLYQLAASDMVVMFDPDPVTINCDRQDLTKRIIISQATVNLISNQNLTNYLFADTNRSIPLNITLNGSHVFYGYVDPLQFSQGYAHNYESITVTATDPLGALEDLKVDDPYFEGSFYIYDENNKRVIQEITPYNLILAILKKIGLDSTNPIGLESINSYVKNVMQNTKIHMAVFFGDSEDDYKNLYEVLEEVCKYFNLYISMYNNDSVILVSTINQTLTQSTVSNFKAKAADDSTSLSTDDVYSQIKLTCNIEPVKDLVVSFDDKDNIYSDYSHPDRYMTEYVSSGEGKSAWDGLYNMINGRGSGYDACYSRDYYMYALRNDAWDFGSNSYIDWLYNNGSRRDQINLLTWLSEQKCRAALVGFGRADENPGNSRNAAITGYVNVDKYLLISTMGTYGNADADFTTFENAIEAAKPICQYKGLNSNILSPVDNKTINYIIISGSMILNPLQRKSGSYWSSDYDKTYNNTFENALANFAWIQQTAYDSDGNPYQTTVRGCWHHTIPITDNGDGGYYQQKWYSGVCGIYGFLDNNKNQTFKYEYNSPGDSTDKITKLPIIACQLKVGSGVNAKYCVERLDQGQNGINKFEWRTLEWCTNNHVEPYFTLGIDPSIGDCIIGKKWQISNNIDYTVNLDATGTAIPIKASDQLAGTIEFNIMGPYNLTWKEVTKSTSHSWIFWKKTSWHEQNKCVLNNIQSIMISSLKVDFKNNNAGLSSLATTADNDLVYSSNYNNTYTETLENDIMICTPLTSADCERLGIKIQNSNSYIYTLNNEAWLGFDVVGVTGHVTPEECFVDYLYKEYHSPAKMVETKVISETFDNGLLGNKLNYEMLRKYFTGIGINGNLMLMSYESSLKDKTIDVKLRECNTITNQQIEYDFT